MNTYSYKCGRRIIDLIQELHKLGYEQMRLAPSMSPSGLYWRGCITHVANISKSNGALANQHDCYAANYTTGQGLNVFDWKDAGKDEPSELARKFINRFNNIASLGMGEDGEYVEWYSAMVEATRPLGLIYAYSDWDEEDAGVIRVIGDSAKAAVPLPPPGWG